MAHAMLHLPLPALEKVARAAIVYVLLVVALRVAGKRELAQLSTGDFVLLLLVSNAVQNGIIGEDNSVTGAAIGAVTLFTVNGALAWVVFRSATARRVVEGSPTVLIEGGQVVPANLERERITNEELQVAIQRQGASDFADVELAVLEPTGALVVSQRAATHDSERLQRIEAKLDALLSSAT